MVSTSDCVFAYRFVGSPRKEYYRTGRLLSCAKKNIVHLALTSPQQFSVIFKPLSQVGLTNRPTIAVNEQVFVREQPSTNLTHTPSHNAAPLDSHPFHEKMKRQAPTK